MRDWASDFTLLAPDVGVGRDVPPGWTPLAELPLVILVGLTGSGKSTAVAGLRSAGIAPAVLPERRTVVERVVFPAVGLGPCADRTARFAATRRFAAIWPGGIAAILARIAVDDTAGPEVYLFDGIRGGDEAASAATALPRALFFLFDLDDAERIARLAGRDDPLDRLGVGRPADPESLVPADEWPPLDAATRRALLARLGDRPVDPARLSRAVAIVAEERLGYDPGETAAALARSAPGRIWAVGAELGPDAVRDRLAAALRAAAPDAIR